MAPKSIRVSKREYIARLLGSRLAVRALMSLPQTSSIVCLCHHRVADYVELDHDIISTTPESLVCQATWIKEHVQTLSGEEIAEVLSGRRPLSGPAVALSFDDGYADNYAAGCMLMERFGIAATFFIPTGFIETGVVPPWDRIGYAVKHAGRSTLLIDQVGGNGPWQVDLSRYTMAMSQLMRTYRELPPSLQATFVAACENAAGACVSPSAAQNLFMSWDQIRRLHAMGHTVGAHTHTHPVLCTLPREAQVEEITRSKDLIEQQLGVRVKTFAYPYGRRNVSFSEATQEIVRQAGFEAGFSLQRGSNRPGRIDPFNIKRINLDVTTSMPMFRTRIALRGYSPV